MAYLHILVEFDCRSLENLILADLTRPADLRDVYLPFGANDSRAVLSITEASSSARSSLQRPAGLYLGAGGV